MDITWKQRNFSGRRTKERFFLPTVNYYIDRVRLMPWAHWSTKVPQDVVGIILALVAFFISEDRVG